jgi:hypothetical protein
MPSLTDVRTSKLQPYLQTELSLPFFRNKLASFHSFDWYLLHPMLYPMVDLKLTSTNYKYSSILF